MSDELHVEKLNIKDKSKLENEKPIDLPNSLNLFAFDITQLSNSCRFSYGTLVATLFSLRFSDERHRVYREELLNRFVERLLLPESSCHALYVYSSKYDAVNCPTFIEDYISVLNREEVLANKPILLLANFLQILLEKGVYDARSRVSAQLLCTYLKVDVQSLLELEDSLVDWMQKSSHYEESKEQKIEREETKSKSKRKKYLMVGLAAVGGGALIGLTGGLAAPLIATGVGALISSAAATSFLGSVAGVAIITSMFGAAGAGLTGYKMNKRVGDVEQFEFSALGNGVGISLTIAISGWLKEGDTFSTAWHSLNNGPEQYTLVWESKYLLTLGQSMEYLMNKVVNAAMGQALKYTILSGIAAAVAWPAALLGASSIIDNPWSCAMNRACECGKQLADVLLSRQQGARPVTLIGFSLGARVIYSCLEELLTRKSSGSEGIVEKAIFLGTPVAADIEVWNSFRHVVAGEIINGYCRSDWLLKFVYRSSSMNADIAGLQPIEVDSTLPLCKFTNIDLTDKIKGHMDYMANMPDILKACGVKTNPIKVPSNLLSLTSSSRKKFHEKPESLPTSGYSSLKTSPQISPSSTTQFHIGNDNSPNKCSQSTEFT